MSGPAWHFIDTGARTGAFNMAFDAGLARRMSADPALPPMLRLYQWQPWAISIGYHQTMRDIDAVRCDEAGVDMVRRPTGGRAILHAEELTYCLVMPAGRKSVLEVYNQISRALVRGLALYGVEVALQKSQPDFRAEYRKAASIPCFASSARYEIEWGGRKLVGSAQRRISGPGGDAVLQHGSILCGPAHRRLPEFLALDDPAAIAELHAMLATRTVDLADILGHEVDLPALSDCIRRGFELEWSVNLAPLAAEAYESLPLYA